MRTTMLAILWGLLLCLSPAASAVPLEVEVVGDEAPLEGAWVLISPVGGQNVPEIAGMVRTGEAVIDQVDREFVPAISVVRPGTAIRFPNHDDVLHHVYSFSPAKTFELPLYKGVDTDPVIFDQAGVVTLGCNIHDWMLAWVLVTDAPVVLRTPEGGRIRTELPPGPYEVRVWHHRAPGEQLRSREVVLGETAGSVGFAFELEPELLRRRPDVLGTDY